jgi:hypothetical protein
VCKKTMGVRLVKSGVSRGQFCGNVVSQGSLLCVTPPDPPIVKMDFGCPVEIGRSKGATANCNECGATGLPRTAAAS